MKRYIVLALLIVVALAPVTMHAKKPPKTLDDFPQLYTVIAAVWDGSPGLPSYRVSMTIADEHFVYSVHCEGRLCRVVPAGTTWHGQKKSFWGGEPYIELLRMEKDKVRTVGMYDIDGQGTRK